MGWKRIKSFLIRLFDWFLLIEPTWDGNCVLRAHGVGVPLLLIEPTWDGNAVQLNLPGLVRSF
jgi:hypothetical protein